MALPVAMSRSDGWCYCFLFVYQLSISFPVWYLCIHLLLMGLTPSLVVACDPTSCYAVASDLGWSCGVVPLGTIAQPCFLSLVPILVLSLNYSATLLFQYEYIRPAPLLYISPV